MTLDESFRAAIAAQDIEVFVKVLRQFKEAGGSRDEAQNCLMRIALEHRSKGEDDAEDLIMNVLDVVVGWCRPCDRIW